MQYQKRTLALSLALLAGICAGASGMQSQPDAPAAVRVAVQTLELQPGDLEVMQRAASTPIDFVAIPGNREFRGELIVHAKQGKVPTAEARVAPLTLRTSSFVPERVIKVPDGMSEGQLAAMLMATGDYEFVEPNWTLYPAVQPNDSQYGSSWQHTRLDSEDAWDIETGGSNIIVAICDSGVDTDHADLQDALIPGFNAASNRSQASGGDVEDINGHGTFVAGCAAAQGNNNTGVTGVGWDFSIMPIRVTNNTDGTASAFAILDGARWAAENGAHIVNASFSGGTSASNQSVGRYLKELGALLFWSSGNDGAYIEPNRPDYVIVGSTTSSDNRSGFSNYGPAVDVTAPGSSVRSTRRFGSYGNGSGTSYASPIAAGVGAMIYSVNPDFSADDVQDILYKSVDDLGASGRDDLYGRGRVNTYSAVLLAQSYERPTLLPLNFDFEDAAWQSLFSVSAGDVETSSPADAPEGVSVLRLDHGDTIVSGPLAGRSLYDDAMFSFALRSEGLEDGDTLLVQYLEDPEVAGEDSWATISQIDARGLSSSSFVRFNQELPEGMQWHGVQMRFVANGSDSSDVWYIDDLSIDLIPDSTVPLDQQFESNTIDPVAWRTVTNAEPVYDNDTFAVRLTDNATLRSHDIPLLQFGFVQPYLHFDAWVDASASPDDTLVVEVTTVGGDWETLATLTASELSDSPEFINLDMPVYTWALDDMEVRFTTDTTGGFLLDNIYLGVEAPSSACSAADIAEPFGELNFFDVSAFLSAFSANEPAADLNGDGQYNFFDVSDYLTQFNAGCP
ncbi:MAG: S8 family serine peptidase [Phycisphaerales bacterium JB052]